MSAIGSIPHLNSNWNDWTASDSELEVITVKVGRGDVIKVGDSMSGLKDRTVQKSFVFITSRVYNSSLAIGHPQRETLKRNHSEGWIPIDCSIFASKMAAHHGVKFPSWIAIADTKLKSYYIGINQNIVQSAVDSVLRNAQEKPKEKVKTKEVRTKNSYFVLTGKGPDLRPAIVSKIQQNGGRVFPKINVDVDYLVTDDPNSQTTKARSAASHGIEVITYDELYKNLK